MEKELFKLLVEFSKDLDDWNETGRKESEDYPFNEPAEFNFSSFYRWLGNKEIKEFSDDVSLRDASHPHPDDL